MCRVFVVLTLNLDVFWSMSRSCPCVVTVSCVNVLVRPFYKKSWMSSICGRIGSGVSKVKIHLWILFTCAHRWFTIRVPTSIVEITLLFFDLYEFTGCRHLTYLFNIIVVCFLKTYRYLFLLHDDIRFRTYLESVYCDSFTLVCFLIFGVLSKFTANFYPF